MPYDYRREGRSEYGRDARKRSEWEQQRMRDEDRFARSEDADFNRDYDSDRSYFAPSANTDREDDSGSGRPRHSYERGPARDASHWGDDSWRLEGARHGRPRSRGPDLDEDRSRSEYRGYGDEGYRDRGYESSAYGDRPSRGSSGLLRWRDRDEGQYFGTGSYYGAYSTGPSARASGSAYEDSGYLGASQELWQDRPLAWAEDDARAAGSSGSSEMYAGSRYGSQGGYERPYGAVSNHQRAYAQDYREQFAEQRYGRNPEFGYGFESDSQRGTFRGRGPKGYERSDERLREMICERLTDDPRIDASDVHIEVKEKIVKLTGTVSDRRSKYEIEDVVERCGGVKDIDNQVRVRAAGMTQSRGSAIRSHQQSFSEGVVGAASSDTDTKSAAARSSIKRT